MDKEIWKKVLRTIPDEKLIQFIQKWKIQVKGFRTINETNIKIAKNMAINEMVKPKKLLKIVEFYENAYSESDLEKFKNQSVEDLVNTYEDGQELHLLLGGLYASEDDVLQLKAVELEQSLLKKYNVNSLEKLIGKDPDTYEPKTEEKKDTTNWKKKWEKTNEIIKNLKVRLEGLESQIADQKNDFKNERRKWLQEKALLQQEAGNAKALVRDIQGQYQNLEKVNKQLKERIERLNAEKNDLHAKLLCLKEEPIQDVKEKSEDVLHVLLIGDPKNRIVTDSTNPKFEIVSAKESLEIDLTHYNEIWMLNYLVPPQFKQKLIERFGGRVKEFKDFITFRTYIKEGRAK